MYFFTFISLDQLLAVMSFNQLIETGRSQRGENSIILSVLPITQSLKRKKNPSDQRFVVFISITHDLRPTKYYDSQSIVFTSAKPVMVPRQYRGKSKTWGTEYYHKRELSSAFTMQ